MIIAFFILMAFTSIFAVGGKTADIRSNALMTTALTAMLMSLLSVVGVI